MNRFNVIVFLTFVLLALSGCDEPKPVPTSGDTPRSLMGDRPGEKLAAVVVGEAQNAKEVALTVGQELRVALPSTPSIPYRWVIVAVADPVLQGGEKSEYVPDPTLTPRPGSGGTAVWTFKAVKAGTQMFKYELRSFDKELAKTVQFSINVVGGGMAGGKEEIVITRELAGKEIVLTVGAAIKIELKSNYTTGYSWKIESAADKVLQGSTQSEYINDPHAPGMVGYGGREIWHFKAVQPGTQTMQFHYFGGPGRDSGPDGHVQFKITVK
ncbi:MAG: protease inhibitor I42 family protein [Planctomycetota bacterium]